MWDGGLRLVADGLLHESATVVKNIVLNEDLGHGLVGRSDHQMSVGPARLIEPSARQGRPRSRPDAAHDLGIGTKERINRCVGRVLGCSRFVTSLSCGSRICYRTAALIFAAQQFTYASV